MTDHKVHKRVMVAVDHSIDSEYAFNEALKQINKENDYLYIISVSPTLLNYPANAMSASIMIDAQRESDKKVHTLLVHYVGLCKRAGVKNFKTFLGTGSHTGEVICRAVEEKNIDTLILGRRGISRLKRLFIGSTSRYCVEHANCSVLCVKLDANLETMSENSVKFSEEVHKESADTFVHQPHGAKPADAAHNVHVAGIPVERYHHQV